MVSMHGKIDHDTIACCVYLYLRVASCGFGVVSFAEPLISARLRLGGECGGAACMMRLGANNSQHRTQRRRGGTDEAGQLEDRRVDMHTVSIIGVMLPQSCLLLSCDLFHLFRRYSRALACVSTCALQLLFHRVDD